MPEHQNQPESYIEVQRILLKNASLETPNTPYSLKEEWQPEVALHLESKNNRIQENIHEVVLSITATVTSAKKTVFLIEVQQAGIFLIKGFEQEALQHVLNSYCPSILFPYARSFIGNTVILAGFPQLILAHVNFDALYAQHLQQTAQQEVARASAQATLNSTDDQKTQ